MMTKYKAKQKLSFYLDGNGDIVNFDKGELVKYFPGDILPKNVGEKLMKKIPGSVGVFEDDDQTEKVLNEDQTMLEKVQEVIKRGRKPKQPNAL